jgi:D-alanyl-D-alanine carboxypeptidase
MSSTPTHQPPVRRPGRAVLGLALALALASAPAAAAQTGELERRLDALTAIGIPGAQVDANGRTAARGVADRDGGRPMLPGLAFRAGSVTKSFTATVALQLVAERRLRFGHTVERWLPGLLPYGETVTIRNLLGHTSGIPDFWEAGPEPLNLSFANDPAVRARRFAPRDLVARVASEPRDFRPGARVEYSNTNYVLLGRVIEKATGRRLGREITRRIIRPLKLTGTRFPTTRKTLPRPFTRGYSLLFGPEGDPVEATPIDVTAYRPSALWAMGNLVSTTRDLRAFYAALLGGRLLPRALTAAMKDTRPNQTPEWPAGIGMGLGIWSWQLPCGRRIYGHEGEVPGSNTWAFGTADGRRVVVLQHNLFYMDWGKWEETVIPTYFSLWCDPA